MNFWPHALTLMWIRNMSLSTNRGMSALMGSQPCLKKGMQTVTVIQNKNE